MGNHASRNFRFDFGVGEPHEGYMKITPLSLYDKSIGYGFTSTEYVSAKARKEAASLRRDFCIPLNTSFIVDVPNGLYRIVALIGDEIAPTETSIAAGPQKRPIIYKQRSVPGQFNYVEFSVKVTEKKLIIAFEGVTPRINAIEIYDAPSTGTLFLAGDSTVADGLATNYPLSGWGQMLPMYLNFRATVDNHAMSGRSSKSYIDEGRLDRILQDIKRDDYLLIQFGHNDPKPNEERHTDPFTTYKEMLKQYIDGARAKAAHPILITPVSLRKFTEDGKIIDNHGDYVIAMKQLAEEEDVPLVDLTSSSKQLFEQLGPEETKDLFVWLAPGEFANYPDGLEDNTHFQQRGAMEIARLVRNGLKGLGIRPLEWFFK